MLEFINAYMVMIAQKNFNKYFTNKYMKIL